MVGLNTEILLLQDYLLTGTPFSNVMQLGRMYCALAFCESDSEIPRKAPVERTTAARTAARDFLLSPVFMVSILKLRFKVKQKQKNLRVY